MSCKHGKWFDCDACAEEKRIWDMAVGDKVYEIESIRARVAELEKDAKRWDYVMRTEPYSGLLWMALPSEVRNRERHLNNAIDAAIERSE